MKASPDTRSLVALFPAQPGSPQQDFSGPAGAVLGLNEELSAKELFEDYRTGCPRWPQGKLLRWQSGGETGFIEGNCGAVNKCAYCAIQTAFVNSMMLRLEAELGTAPDVLSILGTRTATFETKPFYEARRNVVREMRRRYGRGVEYASLQEFTTGLASTSGGQRRPHWNLFWKGIPTDDLANARTIQRRTWCATVDADPAYQYVEEIRDPVAAASYVALHFQKEAQAPPEGWSGQRFNSSRGFYDGRTRGEMRDLAKLEMKRRRLAYRIAQALGCEDPNCQLVAQLVQDALLSQASTVWELVSTTPQRAELLLLMDPATGELPAGHQPAQTQVSTALQNAGV